jgi:uncharacterized repeat protein (TIGR01451 family)
MKRSRVRARGAAALLVLALALATLPSCAASAASAPTYPSQSKEQGPTVRTLPERPAIVGGDQIAVTQAPWQVYVQARIPLGDGSLLTYSCGGSILDATHIATAAHCVFDATSGLRIPNAEFVVRAGASQVDPSNPASSTYPGETAPPVTAIRVHPQYDYDLNASHVSPDDVAVLVLAAPGLTLNGSTEASIAPVAGGAYPALGTLASITGFGRQTQDPTQQPNGLLYGTTTTIGDPLVCGGADNALLDCLSSPTGSACHGDSGGPLTIGGALQGIASFIVADSPSGECGAGSTNGYTSLSAPEIREFVLGDDAPPLAPRGGADIQMQGEAQAGSSLTCSAGTWTNGPTFAYQFVDTRSDSLLQSSSSAAYGLTPADVGRTIACQVLAANAGGTGVSRTVATPAIAAAAAPPPAPPAPEPTPEPTPKPTPEPAGKPKLDLSVRAARAVGGSGGTMVYAIRVTNSGTARAKRVVVCDAPDRGLAFAGTPRGAKKSKGRACWTISSLAAKESATLRLTLRIAHTTINRTFTSRVSAKASNASTRTKIVRLPVKGTDVRHAPPAAVTG